MIKKTVFTLLVLGVTLLPPPAFAQDADSSMKGGMPSRSSRIPDPDSTWAEDARASHLYRELHAMQDRGASENDILRQIVAQFKSVPNVNDVRDIIVFLNDGSMNALEVNTFKVNYTALLADAYLLMAKMQEKRWEQLYFLKKTVRVLHLFEIIHMSDAARCKDPTGWSLFKEKFIVPRVKYISPAYGTYGLEEYRELIGWLKAVDDRFIIRQPSPEVCDMGIQNLPEIEKFEANYVWQERRRLVHSMLEEFWLARYSTYTGVSTSPESEVERRRRRLMREDNDDGISDLKTDDFLSEWN